MTLLDGIVVLIMAASMIRSLVRGVIEEVFSLVAWVVAFLAGKWAAPIVGPLLAPGLQQEALRYFAGFVVAFVVLMVAVMLVGHLLKRLVGAVGLGAADRVVGGVFGALRGLVILIGVSLAAGLTALPQTAFWKQARFSASLEDLAMAARPLLPAKLA